MEAGTILTGYRLPDPVFAFGASTSRSTSTIISEGPADLNPNLGYQRTTNELRPLLLTDGQLDKTKRQVYNDLIYGSERFYGLGKIFKLTVPSLDERDVIDLLQYKNPKHLNEIILKTKSKEDIAIALLQDQTWRPILKATCDYQGLPSQTMSNVLKSSQRRANDRTDLKRYQNQLKNLSFELYAKCGRVPWVLARPSTRRYFVGVAWLPLGDHYIFASSVFDSRGKPLYEKFVIRIFQKAIRDFRSCNLYVIGEVLKQIELSNAKVTLHYHGDTFGLEDVLKKTLDEHCDQWVALSVERPKHPHFRLFSQSTKDKLNEKGIFVPLDKRKCIISTTGLPHFNVAGTPQNLFCESISDLDADQMLEEAKDIYHLAQLNWAYAQGHHCLPVTTLLTSNITTGVRDTHNTRVKMGLPTSLNPQVKPWSFW